MKPGANESLRPPLYATLGFIAQLQKLRSALQKDDFVEVFRPKRAWNFVEVQKYDFFIIADRLAEFTSPTTCINMIIGSPTTLWESVTTPIFASDMLYSWYFRLSFRLRPHYFNAFQSAFNFGAKKNAAYGVERSSQAFICAHPCTLAQKINARRRLEARARIGYTDPIQFIIII